MAALQKTDERKKKKEKTGLDVDSALDLLHWVD